MFKKIRKISAVILAAALSLVMCVAAQAEGDYSTVFKVPVASDFENCKMVGTPTVSEITATGSINPDSVMSVHIYFIGEAADSEFWNDPDGRIEYDVMLNTEGVNAHALLPAFGSGWSWVGPTNYINTLKYGEWVTVSEPVSNYYDNGFSAKAPLSMLLQVVGDDAEAKEVEIVFKDLRFVGVGDFADAPAVDDEDSKAEESEPEESEPEESEPEESKAESTTVATTTTAATTTTPIPSEPEGQDGFVATIIVIVVVAVVVVAGAIVGYVIYRKKKYY